MHLKIRPKRTDTRCGTVRLSLKQKLDIKKMIQQVLEELRTKAKQNPLGYCDDEAGDYLCSMHDPEKPSKKYKIEPERKN